MNIALWIVQVALAALFFMAGFGKLSTPIPELAAQMGWVSAVPAWLVRFIGTAEVLGAIGLIVPAATRILPRLTPLAASGLTAVMLLAAALHLSRGETGMLVMNLPLGLLAAFVVWGRLRKAPIHARRGHVGGLQATGA